MQVGPGALGLGPGSPMLASSGSAVPPIKVCRKSFHPEGLAWDKGTALFFCTPLHVAHLQQEAMEKQ